MSEEQVETVPKSESKPVEKKKARRRHAPNNNRYSPYIYKVLKELDPSIGMSKKSMAIMESMVEDLFERLMSEASALARINKRQTLTVREILAAVNVVMPQQLAAYSRQQIGRAHNSYMESVAAAAKDTKPKSKGKAK